MRFVEQSAEYLPQGEGIQGVYKQIERAGRICYKSEDKITDSLSEAFVKKLIGNGHTAMLEHGTVYLTVHNTIPKIYNRYKENPYSIIYIDTNYLYITTNYRVLVENDWLDNLQYICEPIELHKKRYTMKLVTSVGIVRELLRHRKFSFANESTRFCNYHKKRLGGEITFVIPEYISTDHRIKNTLEDPQYMLYELQEIGNDSDRLLSFLDVCSTSERRYLNTIRLNSCTPQQAREFLPLCTKSEIVMTGFEDDWKHFFDLRLYGKTGKPHPDMVILAQKIKEEFERNGIKF